MKTLKENYERLFGKMYQTDRLGHRISEDKVEKTPSAKSSIRFDCINRAFKQKYPTRTLTQRNGKVYVDNIMLENVDTFLARPNQEVVQRINNLIRRIVD